MRGHEQPTGCSGQSEPDPFKDVRPPADGGTGVPWIAAFDH
jgi:hypothetical protein